MNKKNLLLYSLNIDIKLYNKSTKKKKIKLCITHNAFCQCISICY